MRAGETSVKPRQSSGRGGLRYAKNLSVLLSARQPACSNRFPCTVALASSATKEEVEANVQRWEESGKQGSADSWQWTLNWNEIDDKILVGSCPRSTQDVVELKRVADIDAILCLQSDGCFDALKIDYGELRDKGAQLGVLMSRVAIWDFNHNDQALMIPEAIRKLALLMAMGKRVYVHCTAGINRATLTVVGYLTFVKGWSLDDAVLEVKSKRPQAHPYLDCWHTMRTRFTEGRTPEVLQHASRLYEERKAAGQENHGDSVGDWVRAENALITEQYQRQIQADLTMMMSLTEIDNARRNNSVCLSTQEYNNMQAEMGLLREKAEKDRAKARSAVANAAQISDENRRLREANPDAVALLESSERKLRLKAAEREIDALKGAIRQVAFAALSANSGSDDDRVRASAAPTTATTAAVTPSDGTTSGAAVNGDTVNGAAVNGAQAKGSELNSETTAKMKDRTLGARTSARAHNGASPSGDASMQPTGGSSPRRRLHLGATWPFISKRADDVTPKATVESTGATTPPGTDGSADNATATPLAAADGAILPEGSSKSAPEKCSTGEAKSGGTVVDSDYSI